MIARLFVLADAANVSQEGKLNILGEFNAIWSQRAPAMHLGCNVVGALEFAPEDYSRAHHIELRFVDSDGRIIAPSLLGEVTLLAKQTQPGEPDYVNQIWRIPTLPLPAFGVYVIELWWDQQRVATARFHLKQILPPP